MGRRRPMYEHTIECSREMMCWLYNIADEFKVLKDLGDNTFQVFFRSTWDRDDIKSQYGVSLGWVKGNDRG